jgi:hypothetical protein
MAVATIETLLHERPPLPDEEPASKVNVAQEPIVEGIESETVGEIELEDLPTVTLLVIAFGQDDWVVQVPELFGHFARKEVVFNKVRELDGARHESPVDTYALIVAESTQ